MCVLAESDLPWEIELLERYDHYDHYDHWFAFSDFSLIV